MDEHDRSWLPVGGTDERASGLGSLLDRARGSPAGPVAVGLVVAVALTAGGLLLALTTASPHLELDPQAGESGDGTPLDSPPLVIDVAGAVRAPGLYHLPAGSRVGDAITAAGGFGPGVDAAAANAINLAAPLSDGQQIVVPGRGSSSASSPATSIGSGTRLVDINRASEAELEALPGIGPVTANKIIAARTERPFTSLQELLDRKVMGKATLEKIRALITAG